SRDFASIAILIGFATGLAVPPPPPPPLPSWLETSIAATTEPAATAATAPPITGTIQRRRRGGPPGAVPPGPPGPEPPGYDHGPASVAAAGVKGARVGAEENAGIWVAAGAAGPEYWVATWPAGGGWPGPETYGLTLRDVRKASANSRQLGNRSPGAFAMARANT